MLILPHQETRRDSEVVNGFSIAALSKPALFMAGLMGGVAVSTIYHSALFSYSAPDWSWPMLISSLVPFGLRVRLLLSNDKMKAIKQWSLYGLKLKEVVYEDAKFNFFAIRATACVDNQYYWVLAGVEKNVSLHISKIKKAKVLPIAVKASCLLGLK